MIAEESRTEHNTTRGSISELENILFLSWYAYEKLFQTTKTPLTCNLHMGLETAST